MEPVQKKLEDRIIPVLEYVGTIGAILTSIAYIVVVVVLIRGFKAEGLLTLTVFALVNAAVGFIIMQFLKIQGQTLAENIPENRKVLEEYNNTKTKDKKVRSLRYYWLTSVAKDIGIKCLTIGASTIGVIYIVIEGNGDWQLLGMAFVNLLLFICFGFLSLAKAYKFVNDNHIPYIKERLKEAKEESLDGDTRRERSDPEEHPGASPKEQG